MDLKGNTSRYGALAVALHWISAAGAALLLLLGFMAANATDGGEQIALLRMHVPLGTTILVLTLARIVWWFFDKRPDEPAGQPRWQGLAAKVVQTLLYMVLILMGVSGIGLLVLSGAAGVIFFGSEAPPQFTDFAPMIVHGAGAFALLALTALHIGAALSHQFLWHDHALARMGLGATKRRL